jgi:hypothetical protein
MPHMIDRVVMREMQDKWVAEWRATSMYVCYSHTDFETILLDGKSALGRIRHRFRSPSDLQYAFSYFFYLMNRNKLADLDVVKYIAGAASTRFRLLRNEFYIYQRKLIRITAVI